MKSRVLFILKSNWMLFCIAIFVITDITTWIRYHSSWFMVITVGIIAIPRTVKYLIEIFYKQEQNKFCVWGYYVPTIILFFIGLLASVDKEFYYHIRIVELSLFPFLHRVTITDSRNSILFELLYFTSIYVLIKVLNRYITNSDLRFILFVLFALFYFVLTLVSH